MTQVSSTEYTKTLHALIGHHPKDSGYRTVRPLAVKPNTVADQLIHEAASQLCRIMMNGRRAAFNPHDPNDSAPYLSACGDTWAACDDAANCLDDDTAAVAQAIMLRAFSVLGARPTRPDTKERMQDHLIAAARRIKPLASKQVVLFD